MFIRGFGFLLGDNRKLQCKLIGCFWWDRLLMVKCFKRSDLRFEQGRLGSLLRRLNKKTATWAHKIMRALPRSSKDATGIVLCSAFVKNPSAAKSQLITCPSGRRDPNFRPAHALRVWLHRRSLWLAMNSSSFSLYRMLCVHTRNPLVGVQVFVPRVPRSHRVEERAYLVLPRTLTQCCRTLLGHRGRLLSL